MKRQKDAALKGSKRQVSQLIKMKSTMSQKQLDQLKSAKEIASQAKKQTKAALKAQIKALKAHLKPFKSAYKHAKQMEEEAQKAYKAYLKELKKAVAEEARAEAIGYSQPEVWEEEKKEPKKKKSKKSKSSGDAKKETDTADSGAEKTSQKDKSKIAAASSAPDDLSIIKGVGDKVAEALRANGINTFADMAGTSVERFREILRENKMSQFRNPSNWAASAAALANMEPIAEVAAPVKKSKKPGRTKAAANKTGKGPGRPKKASAAETTTKQAKSPGRPKKAATEAPAEATVQPAKKAGRPKKASAAETTTKQAKSPGRPKKAATETTVKQPAKKAGRPKKAAADKGAAAKKVKSPGRPKTATKTGAKKGIANAAKNSDGTDDLTKIKGIGDAVAGMLRANGIVSYSDAAKTSYDRFKELLRANNMSKYRNPTNWAKEAARLAKG